MKHVPDTSWERAPGGHLSDAGVEAVADGQPVSAESSAHAEACDTCAQRVADAALLTEELHCTIRALAEEPAREAAPVRAVAPVRPRSPVPYIAVALLVALVATVPTMATLPGQAAGLAASTKLQLGGFRQVGSALFAEVSAPAASLFLAGVLVAVGAGIAVWGTKRERRNNHGFA
jgi:hypothetical protein